MDTDIVVTETLSQAVARQADEIERLRKDFSDLLRVAADDASEYQAEIERLRGIEAARDAEIKALRDTIPPLIENNERLREQVAVWLECYKTEKTKREDLAKRIREALGDG